MRTWLINASLMAILATASPATAQTQADRTLDLSFDAGGRVTLVARNVTVRDILFEWAQQCGCFIVNADKLVDGPLAVPVQFEGASQASVLESLLRDAAGYVLTPRREGTTGASNYETIYILATSSAVAGAYVPPPPVTTSAQPLPTTGFPDDEIPPVVPPAPTAAPPDAPPATGNPFGSRTSSPNVFTTPGPGGAQPAAPGTLTPAPPSPGPPGTLLPYGSGMPSGTPVPIVPVPSSSGR